MNKFSYKGWEKRGPEKKNFRLASFFKGYDAICLNDRKIRVICEYYGRIRFMIRI